MSDLLTTLAISLTAPGLPARPAAALRQAHRVRPLLQDITGLLSNEANRPCSLAESLAKNRNKTGHFVSTVCADFIRRIGEDLEIH